MPKNPLSIALAPLAEADVVVPVRLHSGNFDFAAAARAVTETVDLALHFANRVWQFNTAEIMGTTQTDPKVYAAVVSFAEAIGMVPIELHREKAGYVLNSLLVPFLNAAAGLAAGGYADPADVDKTWRIATGAPLGPFQMFDIIGLQTPYNIMAHGDATTQKLATWLKTNYIDKGKLGLASGEGFYAYK